MNDVIKFIPRAKKGEPPPLPTHALVPVRACQGGYGPGQPALRVLIAIAAHIDGDSAYVSISRLSEITGINRGGISRAIKELEYHGLIWHEQRRRPNGSLAANRYMITAS